MVVHAEDYPLWIFYKLRCERYRMLGMHGIDHRSVCFLSKGHITFILRC